MGAEEKIFPYKGVNLDVHESLMTNDLARFIKNLIYEVTDTSDATASRGSQTGVAKTMETVSQYIENLTVPKGYNQVIGAFAFKQTKQVFVFLLNDLSSHRVYVLNGADQTYNIIKEGSIWNFQLNPEQFVADTGCWLEVIYVEDPGTGLPRKRSLLMFTDGFNYQRQICVEDSIATGGFDPARFPYFRGTYDPRPLVSMGLPSPIDCVEVTEVPRTDSDKGVDNTLSYNTWQFRIMDTDVWGRPSEHGIISDEYIPGINDCLSGSNNLPRCLKLKFDAGSPIIDKKQIEFRNCNSGQWYLDKVLFLYSGSNLGDWWLRERNPDIEYNPSDNTITYTFCRDKECNPVPAAETDRLENPLPRSSQAIQKINQFMGLANNKKGFSPFSKSLIDKFHFKIDPPEKIEVNSRTITIYIPIWNEGFQNFQQVNQEGTNGFIWGDNNTKHGGARAYSQFFTNKSQSGFPGYLLGNGNLAFSTQVYLDANGNIVDDPEHKGMNISPTHFTMQKFVFNNIPSGKYIFRLASHLSDPAAGDNYRITSTTVWGLCHFDKVSKHVNPAGRIHSQELLIDVCDGDYNSLDQTQILVIADLASYRVEDVPGPLVPITAINSSTFAYKATCGYIFETRQNGFNQNPVELMSVTQASGPVSLITDHNGFYYFATSGAQRTCTFRFYYKCQINNFGIAEGSTGMRFLNFYLDETSIQGNFRPYGDYFTLECNRVLIKGTVFLNGQNVGVPNATVILTRGGLANTDDDGNFTLITHDEVGLPQRNDFLVFGNGVCNYSGPDGKCIEIKNITIVHCSTCVKRELLVGTFNLLYGVQRGLLSGGTYGMGVALGDWVSRRGFVQDLGYITIPSIIESQAIGPSTVTAEIDSDAVFEDYINYITFFITRETTMSQYLSWIVDRFDLIDNTGSINTVAPTQIRIYYASLIEYNKQNNYNTTTAWNFIPEGQNLPVINDKVQFFLNGDGKFFTKTIIALVKYDQVGQYFLIDYTPDLSGLVANALIRLMRPKVCTGDEPYYEICGRIKIVNGVPEKNSEILSAFDTFYLSRQIPVPIPVAPTPAVQSIATTVPITGGGTQTTTVTPIPVVTADAQRIFGFRFEHDSPSNFWGKGCINIGRINVKNPYEAVIFDRDQIALSGALSKNGQLNYLNYFDTNNMVSFDINTLNGIIGMFTQNSRVLVIGQNDCFIVGFNDDIPVINAQGQLTIPAGKNQFGNPQSVSGNYGCKYFDKNTLRIKEGVVQFLDTTTMYLIQHNFTSAYPISFNAVDGYLKSKIASVANYNLVNKNKRYFVGVIDTSNNSYLLTDFIIRSNNFLNELREEDANVSETMAFDIYGKTFKGWFGFTPEYLCSLEGELNENQLFSFTGGIPWSHYSTKDIKDYGSVYGKPVESIFDVVCVIDNMKKKKPLAIAQYISGGMFFCDKATTENNQETRMLVAAWIQANYGWYAPFLCDLNTPFDKNIPDRTGKNKLMDGNIIVGNWIRIRLVGTPDTNKSYIELQGITASVMAVEKS